MQKFIGHCGMSMINNQSFYFANRFDWIMMNNMIKKNTEIPKTIYIKLDFLPQYMNTILSLKNDFVLITGCSDYSPQVNFKKEYNQLITHPKLKKWYAENNLSTHEKIQSLPVGFATHSKEYEDKLLEIRKTININEKTDKIFCCWRQRNENCCGKEFIERGTLTSFVNEYPEIFKVEPPNLKESEFQKYLSLSKYCMCPLGNGVDCAPKILECFFLKTIPIVRKNANCLNLYKKYPVIWVDNFLDILNMTLEYDKNIDWDSIINEFTCDYWYNKIINSIYE